MRVDQVAEHIDLARLASPITHVHPGAPPILAFHGTADGLISIEQSRRFIGRAKEVGMSVQLVEVEGADHGFATIDVEPILDRSIDFIAGHVRQRTAR